VRPVLIDAEVGDIGADVSVVADAEDSSISYLTTAPSVYMPPADLGDPRIVSLEVSFPEAGDYQVYVRARLGPGLNTNDSFFLNAGSDETPNWINLNGFPIFPVEGELGHSAEAIVNVDNGVRTAGVWGWALFEEPRITVDEGGLTRTIRLATREEGFDLDKLAFALLGDGHATGFTASQLDAGEVGTIVAPPPDPYEPPPTQVPLATGKSKFLGMVCCGNQRPFLENYFNQIAPENAGKWALVEGERDVFTWDALDEAFVLARDNDFPFRFHVLVWGSQQPDWVEELPPEEQLTEIRQWFEAVADRYGEGLDFVEVVNEFQNQPPTAENEGKYIDALGGPGETGFDWVLNAFRMAREIFPASTQLMLNEFNVVNNTVITGTYVQLVELLMAEDLIDAIGVQGHAFSTTGPIDQMVQNLDRLGATGLPIYVTEMDIDGPAGRQLIDYQRVFRAFWEHPNVKGVTLWGYRDGMWRDPQGATLIHGNGAEKPAMRWLKGYFRGGTPVVSGPPQVTLSAATTAMQTEAFLAVDPDGSAYPDGTVVSWGVVDGPDPITSGAHAVGFALGTNQLELVETLEPGTYHVRIYADVDATVSELYEVEVVVE